MRTARTAAPTRAAAAGAFAPAIAPLLVVTVAVAAPAIVEVTLWNGVMVPVDTSVVVIDPLVSTLEVVTTETLAVTVAVVVIAKVERLPSASVTVVSGKVETLPLASVTVVNEVAEAVVVPVPVVDDVPEKSEAATVNGLLVV